MELTASKRLSGNWQMMASYLWSKLEGNYDGNYVPDVNQQMPNISVAYDVAETTIHNDGYLSNDRRHQAKVAAAYSFRFGLTAGASAYYRTGTPLSAIGYGFGYPWYLSQRGAWGRTLLLSRVHAELYVAARRVGPHRRRVRGQPPPRLPDQGR